MDVKVSVSNDGKPLDLKEDLIRGQLKDITGDGERTLTFDPLQRLLVRDGRQLLQRQHLRLVEGHAPDDALRLVSVLPDERPRRPPARLSGDPGEVAVLELCLTQ